MIVIWKQTLYTVPQRAKLFVEVPNDHQNLKSTSLSVVDDKRERIFFLIGEFNTSYWFTCQNIFSFHASANQSI